jgi:SAM-dependent methyltransferase
MTNPTGDRWAAASAYEAYMGRWSRALAKAFLQWLEPAPSAHWFELGCGTGALSAAILESCDPKSLTATEPSAPFLEFARDALQDLRVTFVNAGADAPPSRDGGFDVSVSGLVLNFVPKLDEVLVVLRERLRAGGVLGAYVWDYASGMEFLRHFWDEVVALDAAAAGLDEGRRFGPWQPSDAAECFRRAGISRVESAFIAIPTEFEDFDDYWRPFLGGTGPAPAYVAGLEPERRERLRERLEQRLPRSANGRIALRARAVAVRGVAP